MVRGEIRTIIKSIRYYFAFSQERRKLFNGITSTEIICDGGFVKGSLRSILLAMLHAICVMHSYEYSGAPFRRRLVLNAIRIVTLFCVLFAFRGIDS